ncbi:carboxymuconolactone decarboxylase family protein [Rhizobium sp. BK602]|uniref:carboxymuconolactone decarboxylase family protein n=1 Tax=Rhizobium sp. BK602 TaxID=2586986 RepID=UPI0017B12A29|nr:carboxymuconolactone decarboxylase family protein [Rhizobium sp. BK602]MBB3610576.1 4-carboxymuconolactone decarboxylase [Rhizobium sp. BK602]
MEAITIDDVRAVAPALAKYTEDAIVNGLWKRSALSARDRSIITVSALVAGERTIGFAHYFNTALATGVTPAELSEIVTQVAFYAGWSTAFSAVAVLKDIFAQRGIAADQLPPVAPELLTPQQALPGDDARVSILQETFGAIVPGLVEITNDLLYGEVWLRPNLSVHDRNLATVTALIATGQTEFLGMYLAKAAAVGVTKAEISELITHLAFYIGWPAALSAAVVAKGVFEGHGLPK